MVVSTWGSVDKKVFTYMRPSTNLIVFEEVTLFGDQNSSYPQLADPAGSSGIDMNDVRQGSLGDCYFMAALLALADNHPAWILGQITGTPFSDYYTIKMYNQDGTRYQDILFDKYSNLLSNGEDMARFFDDYLQWIENSVTYQAYEIWPQIYEKAWAYCHGGKIWPE